MEDIEILEGSPLVNEKEISKTVRIKSMDNPNQRVVINGEEFQSKTFVLHCPSCGRVVHFFDNPGVTIVDVIKTCNEGKDKLLDIVTYCPKCGQKLNYDVWVFDVNVTETPIQEPSEKPTEDK